MNSSMLNYNVSNVVQSDKCGISDLDIGDVETTAAYFIFWEIWI